MGSYVNEHGKLILTGDDAIKGWVYSMNRLVENRKLHYKTSFQGLPISIENRKGSIRKGIDEDGDEWKTKMKIPYGYIRGTEGVDGDALDTFVGPEENAAYAYVVHCNTPEGDEFDEDKVMLGFASKEQAERCFRQHYDDDKFFGGIDEIPMWQFREKIWVKKHTTKKLVASMREGASLQVPQSFFERLDTFGRGTDQDMKKSILGHHPDIMEEPKVREHGVQGQKWGVVNPRQDTGKPRSKPDLANDPRTMNMMQVIKRSQPQLNAIGQWQKNRAARLAQQNQKPPSQQQHHNEALDKLKELGWKALEVGARLTGMETALGVVKSVVRASDGSKAVLKTDRQGNHSLKPTGGRRRSNPGMKASVREAKTFLREHGILGQKWGIHKEREAGFKPPEKLSSVVDKFLKSSREAKKLVENPDEERPDWAEKYVEAQSIYKYSGDPSTYDAREKKLQDYADSHSKLNWDPKKFPRQAMFSEAGISKQDYLKYSQMIQGYSSENAETFHRSSDAIEKHAKNMHDGEFSDPMTKALYLESRISQAAMGGSKDDTVKLYRGLIGTGGKDPGRTPIESWTSDKEVAKKFSGTTGDFHYHGSQRFSKEEWDKFYGKGGSILEADIPKKFVLFSPQGKETDEKEYVISLPQDFKTKAKYAKPWRESIRRIDSFGRRLREANTYYARSLSRYGTDAEESDIDLIKESFGGSVNSPKTKRHAELGMGYFHKKIDAAKRVVIKPIKKNRLTAGVFSEATHALKAGKPVYAIRKGIMRRVKSVEALSNANNEGHFGRIRYFKSKKK